MTYRFIFDPISGQFEFRKIQQSENGTGGGEVISGALVISSGTTFSIIGSVFISAGSEILVEIGGEILIQ